MQARFQVFISIIIIVVPTLLFNGCSSPPPPTRQPTPTIPTPEVVSTIFVKQPEPSRPQIKVIISGLLNSNDLVTMHIYKGDGHEVLYGTRQGNGEWEAVITDVDENEDYTLIAEVQGYISQPASYMIRIKGETAYLAENNQLGEEAIDLRFHFILDTP